MLWFVMNSKFCLILQVAVVPGQRVNLMIELALFSIVYNGTVHKNIMELKENVTLGKGKDNLKGMILKFWFYFKYLKSTINNKLQRL